MLLSTSIVPCEALLLPSPPPPNDQPSPKHEDNNIAAASTPRKGDPSTVCHLECWVGPRRLTCLVCEQVRNPPQLLRNRAGTDHSPRDFGIPPNHPAVHDLPHVQIHTQTGQEIRAKWLHRVYARLPRLPR